MKIKKWFLFSFVILALTFGVFGLTSMSNVKKAKAETYRTSKFLTKGTTSVDGATPTNGCPDNFKVYMCGAYTDDKTSEIYRSAIIDWTYYKITVEVKNVSNHIAFSMTRNGYTIYKKSLSGNGNITLYSDSLTDGEYAFEYTCNYKSGFLGLVTTNYSYKFCFEVDKTAPVNSLKAGGSYISSGSYTNKQVVYSASDKNFSKKYNVTVTDECVNESVYEFEIVKAKKPVNVGLIIAFVVSMLVAAGAATFLIIKKRREG